MARPVRFCAALLAAVLGIAGCSSDPAMDPGPTAGSSTTAPSSSPPPDEPGDTAGYASAFLGAGGASGSDDVFVHASVWAPPGEEPFANGEFFVLGYDCLTEQTVPATVDGLESATARGELALTCGSHTAEGEVTGTAVLDLTWTAEGEVRQHTIENPDGTCAEEISERHAVVRGEVHLVIPELDYDGVATSLADDDDSVSRGVSPCS